jgi:hypothetical protein
MGDSGKMSGLVGQVFLPRMLHIRYGTYTLPERMVGLLRHLVRAECESRTTAELTKNTRKPEGQNRGEKLL